MPIEQHVQDQERARTTLVKTRREYAVTLAKGYHRGTTEEAIKGFIEVQQAIKVIDDARSDEGSLMNIKEPAREPTNYVV